MGIRANDLLRLDREPWLPAVPPPLYAGGGRRTLGQASRPVLHSRKELRSTLPAGDWRQVAYPRVGWLIDRQEPGKQTGPSA